MLALHGDFSSGHVKMTSWPVPGSHDNGAERYRISWVYGNGDRAIASLISRERKDWETITWEPSPMRDARVYGK